ncbi:hypothetical protein [Streptomyces sp. 6N223]|uniref:hypothetical protein n=1 Tax=Streptomyces sp. 6N223 TaxID=3457412 RepID=UPI003FD5A80D
MTDSRVLYLITCAAPPAQRIRTGIEKAQAAGWDVCLVPTPSAARWLDAELVPHVPKHGNLDAHPWEAALAALP